MAKIWLEMVVKRLLVSLLTFETPSILLHITRNLCVTRRIIKLSTHRCWPLNVDWFLWGWKSVEWWIFIAKVYPNSLHLKNRIYWRYIPLYSYTSLTCTFIFNGPQVFAVWFLAWITVKDENAKIAKKNKTIFRCMFASKTDA